LDLITGKAEPEKVITNVPAPGSLCAAVCYDLGDYIVYRERWVSKKTFENVGCGMQKGSCLLGAFPANGAAEFFSVAQRKSRSILCFGTADSPLPTEPVRKQVQTVGKASSTEPTQESDWPMFRGSVALGNSSKAVLGDAPTKVWETRLGLGGKSFGVMAGQWVGLTQPVVAYGLAIVSDIEGQRIVAVNATDGKQKWVFHVGSRVEYTPTLYNGLCLFAAKDGWVYCLDAKTGALVWKNLIFAAERYIGSHEQLENRGMMTWDGMPKSLLVWVVGGVGYVDAMVFKPETGEPTTAAWKAPVGRTMNLRAMDTDVGGFAERMATGNSIPRQQAENAYPRFNDGRAAGMVLAFDEALSVSYNGGGGEHFKWSQIGLTLTAVSDTSKLKKPLWSVSNELLVDDILLTPTRIYCVGHFPRVKKTPELGVVAREDGKVVGTVPVDGFPSFLGMSAAGNRLFVATRDGKLICYQGAK
jgi:hypothetical protein